MSKRRRALTVRLDWASGKDTETIEVESGTTVRDMFPRFGYVEMHRLTTPNLVCSINGEPACFSTKLEDGDWVFFMHTYYAFDDQKREVVLEWLRYENYLRTAPWTLEALKQAETEDAWMDMIEGLTFRKVMKLIAVSEDRAERLIHLMKTAAEEWPHDKRFHEVSLWRKFNRAGDVSFKQGDCALDGTIQKLEDDGTLGAAENLSDAREKPAVIVSSSMT